MPAHRLDKYFKPLPGKGYAAKDPPFSRMDLVTCRNVLIYLTKEAQSHVLKVLHFALEKGSSLFLGTSETTGPQRELYSTLSKSHRIYRKLGASRPVTVPRSRTRQFPRRQGQHEDSTDGVPSSQHAIYARDLARRAVVKAFAPPTIVVLNDGTIAFAHGELQPYLQMPQGDNPRFELHAVMRPHIATRTRSALYKCRRSQEVVTTLTSPDGTTERVHIEARPAPTVGDDAVMLTFDTVAEPTPPRPLSEPHEDAEDKLLIEELERELQATREDLSSTVEELETSNEELRSSSEESMSMNEELQSANEELEATSEELRSLNEELTTVNTQLREKVNELEQAHDDLNNFHASTKIATIFLDERLRVKRFTPAARALLKIDYADTGQLIGGFARELLQHDLPAEAEEVLENLNVHTREINTRDGARSTTRWTRSRAG